jgi:hypothetical protein
MSLWVVAEGKQLTLSPFRQKVDVGAMCIVENAGNSLGNGRGFALSVKLVEVPHEGCGFDVFEFLRQMTKVSCFRMKCTAFDTPGGDVARET